jgi:uncharacterized membrane protein
MATSIVAPGRLRETISGMSRDTTGDSRTDRADHGTTDGREFSLRPALPWLLATLALGLAAIIIGTLRLEALPDPYPVHFGPAGDPDRFTDRSLGSVLVPVIVGQLSGLSVFATLLLVRAQGHRRMVTPLAAIGFVIGGGISLVSVAQYLSADATPPGWSFWLLLLAVVLAVGWAVAVAVQEGRTVSDDRTGWKLGGLVYADPDDPEVFVPKRTGVGMTINLGRPVGWLVLALILLPGLIIVAAVTLWT